MPFKDLQGVRTTEPITGEDAFVLGRIHHLPKGQVGTIVHVHGGGRAYEVEFVLGERGVDGFIEHPECGILTLASDQLEAAP